MTNNFDKVLMAVQGEIPIIKRPFWEIGQALDLEEDEVLEAVKVLKENKIIRQISPIYDTRMLGYDSALVAFRVKPERVEEVSSFVNTYPGVSHNYERTHEFNLWFTIAVPLDVGVNLEGIVKFMAECTDVYQYIILRALRVFKIGVKLDYESAREREEVSLKGLVYKPLTHEEKNIVKVTQEDMPLVKRPFFEYAKSLGMEEEELIQKLVNLKQKGVLRRISAIVYHTKVGFLSNAMSVWKVNSESVERVGNHLASFKGVSHCYERTTSNGWNYNLFAMIHGRTKEEIWDLVKVVSEETGVYDYKLLFSVREFKKRRVRYFSEEFYRWLEEVYKPLS
ncbi:MAG: Lrp/AsnC family transcriptional regulator [Aquificaceae bacterium]